MRTKLTMACMALAAFAAFVVLPATASATNDPLLTHPTGTAIPVGSNILATQVGVSKLTNTETNSTQLECTTAELTGTLLKNSGGTVEGEITATTFGGTGGQAVGEPHTECTGSFANASVTPKVPMCIKSTPLMKTDEVQILGGKCGAAEAVTFTIAPTGLAPCVYDSTTNALVATYKTHPEDGLVTVDNTVATNGFSKTSGSFFCPASSHLDLTVTLETDTNKSADPIYIS